MLGAIPDGEGVAYSLDGVEVDRTSAEAAWDAQSPEWQRGRTLGQALEFWQGRMRRRY